MDDKKVRREAQRLARQLKAKLTGIRSVLDETASATYRTAITAANAALDTLIAVGTESDG